MVFLISVQKYALSVLTRISWEGSVMNTDNIIMLLHINIGGFPEVSQLLLICSYDRG